MKNLMIGSITLSLILIISTKGFTGERELHGLLIGAGSGAIIGNAIGGNTESTLLGSAIGGAVGVAVGNASHHGMPFPPPFILPPPFHQPPKFSRHSKRHHVRDRNRCRVVKKSVYRNGQPYTVTKRICREPRDSYARDRWDDDDYYYDRRNRNYRDRNHKKQRRFDKRWNRPYNN